MRAELWQDGFMVAAVDGDDEAQVSREIGHYAALYSQDGPCILKWPGSDEPDEEIESRRRDHDDEWLDSPQHGQAAGLNREGRRE